ncbi:CidA/LrgA family protein [Alkalihalobacillus trypoxylicola]|uniref:Holin n=1 Tax=Alkalihalobacillus trypoxylicola TaxID=519424 RepID=A0A162CUF5_9BACI|nr:CidA/LrgA family protein [Alkalihalobacillus trypoxylicola]KYG26689.1 hypothetical protein AZF04_12860 [Alkalihalobacillus trypoxylicola]
MMRIFQVIIAVIIIYLYNMAGGWIQHQWIPYIPGSLIGMGMMFITLLLGGEKIFQWLNSGSHLLIKLLPLFFVPVTVGIIQYRELISWFGVIIFFSVVLSSLIVLWLTSFIIQKIMLLKEKKQQALHILEEEK